MALLGLFALGAGMDVGVDVGVGRALLLRCLCASLVGVRARLGLLGCGEACAVTGVVGEGRDRFCLELRAVPVASWVLLRAVRVCEVARCVLVIYYI